MFTPSIFSEFIWWKLLLWVDIFGMWTRQCPSVLKYDRINIDRTNFKLLNVIEICTEINRNHRFYIRICAWWGEQIPGVNKQALSLFKQGKNAIQKQSHKGRVLPWFYAYTWLQGLAIYFALMVCYLIHSNYRQKQSTSVLFVLFLFNKKTICFKCDKNSDITSKHSYLKNNREKKAFIFLGRWHHASLSHW